MYRHHRTKVDPDILVKAFVKRRNDIIGPNMIPVPLKSPGWSLLAADLEHKYALITLYQLMRRPDILKALIANNTDTGIPYKQPSGYRGRIAKPLYKIVTKKNTGVSTQTNGGPSKFEPHNIDKIPTRRAQLVLPKGYPKIDLSTTQNHVPKEEPSSSRTVENTENEKTPVHVDGLVKNLEVHVERLKEMTGLKKRGSQSRIEPNVVIKEILARRDDIVQPSGYYRGTTARVWKQIANVLGNRISPVTVFNMAQRKEVREMMIDEKVTNPDVSARSREHRYNIERNIVTNALLKHRAEIIRPDGSYVPKENPVWSRIAKDVGNISAIKVCNIAYTQEVREQIIDNKKRIATTSADDDRPLARRKIELQITIDAILARRAEIVNSEGRYATKEDPVWMRIAKDLGNVIAPLTVYTIACRKEVHDLVLPRDIKGNILNVPVEAEREDAAGTDNIRNEINQMVFEDAIQKILKTIDSNEAVSKEIKELRKDLRERNTNKFAIDALSKEIKELRKDLRERNQNNFDFEALSAEIKELRKDLHQRENINFGIEVLAEEFNELRAELRERDNITFGTEGEPIMLN